MRRTGSTEMFAFRIPHAKYRRKPVRIRFQVMPRLSRRRLAGSPPDPDFRVSEPRPAAIARRSPAVLGDPDVILPRRPAPGRVKSSPQFGGVKSAQIGNALFGRIRPSLPFPLAALAHRMNFTVKQGTFGNGPQRRARGHLRQWRAGIPQPAPTVIGNTFMLAAHFTPHFLASTAFASLAAIAESSIRCSCAVMLSVTPPANTIPPPGSANPVAAGPPSSCGRRSLA